MILILRPPVSTSHHRVLSALATQKPHGSDDLGIRFSHRGAHGYCSEQLVSVIYSLGGMNYQTDTLLFQKEKKEL